MAVSSGRSSQKPVLSASMAVFFELLLVVVCLLTAVSSIKV